MSDSSSEQQYWREQVAANAAESTLALNPLFGVELDDLATTVPCVEDSRSITVVI